MSVAELQAVILAAGRGSRMTELVNPLLIKCLLPICGNPLIFYSLKFLSQSGFREALVIVQDREKDEVKRVVDKLGDKLGLTIDYFPVPEDSEEFGTAHSLQLAHSAKKIVRDVLLISSDTITNAPLLRFLNYHRTYDSDCTAFFLSNLPALTGKVPGPKCKVQQDRDIVGIEPTTSRLVYLAPEADLDENISLPLTTVKKCPHFKLLTWLKDSHIYLIRKRVLDLHIQGKYTSVKGDFIPFLINSQFREQQENNKFEKLSIFAFIEFDRHVIRVNTVPNYATICKSASWLYRTFDIEINPGAGAKLTGSIAGSAKLKAAVVGDQCILKDNVKLTNTILMDNVEVEEGSVLDNCIVSSGAKIGAKCVLKECLVGPKYSVPEGGQFVNEYFSVSDDTFF